MTVVDIALVALSVGVALLLAALVVLGRVAYRIGMENADLRRELEGQETLFHWPDDEKVPRPEKPRQRRPNRGQPRQNNRRNRG